MTKRPEISGTAINWAGGLLALAIALIFAKFHMQQKWDAAAMWTLVAFVPSTAFCRRYWNKWKFWAVWLIFLIIHICLIVAIFHWLLKTFTIIGTVYVVPFAFLECFLLVGLAAKTLTRISIRAVR